MKAITAGAVVVLLAMSVPAAAAPPRCMGERATITGTGGPDTLEGTPNRDVIVGRGGADTIDGAGGGDIICGGGGSDQIQAGPGRDRVRAGGGSDHLSGGPGNDVLHGGRRVDEDLEWYDTVSYADAAAGVQIDMKEGRASGEGEDVLQHIEIVEGSQHDDEMIGRRDAWNEFYGLGGNDRLVGGAHGDQLAGGPGDDSIDGGNRDQGNLVSRDEITFEDAAGPVTVDLTTGEASGEGEDTFTNIGDVVGSEFDDTLIGNDRPNTIRALGGNDTVQAHGGDDALLGDAGDDDLDGGEGEDYARGYEGNDRCVAEREMECERD